MNVADHIHATVKAMRPLLDELGYKVLPVMRVYIYVVHPAGYDLDNTPSNALAVITGTLDLAGIPYSQRWGRITIPFPPPP